VYYAKNCGALDGVTSQCLIHGAPQQNLICKSYDAHACWYREAFVTPQNDQAIFFDLERLMFLEKKTDLLRRSGQAGDAAWDDIRREIAAIPCPTAETRPGGSAVVPPLLLPFKKCLPEHYLFFPPYGKPQREIHFELASFRLGFPGMSLAVTDNYWAYMLRTELNEERFGRLVGDYFPSLNPGHGSFGFPELHKRMAFFSETGENWIMLHRERLPLLRRVVRYDAFGNIIGIPGTRELLSILRFSTPYKPDKAA
jgi:hypothetical protein